MYKTFQTRKFADASFEHPDHRGIKGTTEEQKVFLRSVQAVIVGFIFYTFVCTCLDTDQCVVRKSLFNNH